jgi:selenocysteine lyase/cysteine desulfurase/tryptophan 2,3-dioxygenase
MPSNTTLAHRSEAAELLQRTLSRPIYNRTLRKDVGRGELDYEIYLRTAELLALQTPPSELVIPDELLFQVIHQTQELWLKCAAFEATTLVDNLDREQLFAASSALDRIVQMTRLVGEQIRVLFTLSPSRFHIIRRSLGNGSGLESPGYNQMLTAADAAWDALERLLGRRGATVLHVYQAPDSHPDLHRIGELFVDWDSAFQKWLVEHFTLVRRTLGIDKTVQALDGFPTVALSARMTRPLFPALWAVRVEMSREWTREGGFAPGQHRVGESTLSPPQRPTPEAASNESKALQARAEFPLLAQCVYLNSNSTGALPRAARRALDGYWQTLETWRDEIWERWWQELAAYAIDLASLLGAPVGSIACDSNLATLFGRLLSCFDYRTRPRVVSTALEFPSTAFILRAFRRYGADPVFVPSRDGISIDVEQLVREIDERTQLVCLSHATYSTGALIEIDPVVRRAREVGALVALDAYQSVGAVPIDVARLDVDFLLAGAHKWLCGSLESAFLYARPALLPQLEPAATGWIASQDPLSFAPLASWASDARRLVAGTPAVLPALMSRPGLALIRDVGLDEIRRLSLTRTDYIIARADEAGLPIATPRSHAQRGAIVTLRFAHDATVARKLVAAGFICSYRDGIRIAPHFYNGDDEIGRFMDMLVRTAREVQ